MFINVCTVFIFRDGALLRSYSDTIIKPIDTHLILYLFNNNNVSLYTVVNLWNLWGGYIPKAPTHCGKKKKTHTHLACAIKKAYN